MSLVGADHALFGQTGKSPHLQRIILCLDNDEAGRQAMERMHEAGWERYNDVSVLFCTLKIEWGLQMDSKLKLRFRMPATEGMISNKSSYGKYDILLARHFQNIQRKEHFNSYFIK